MGLRAKILPIDWLLLPPLDWLGLNRWPGEQALPARLPLPPVGLDCQPPQALPPLKLAENNVTQIDFTNFCKRVSVSSNSIRFRSWRALHIRNLSNRCKHEYDPSISRIF